MQEQARGPLALGDDVIRAETGRDSESWYIMLDAGGARQLSHGQIVELLAGVYGLEDRWAGIMAVRYEAARAIDRAVAVPADLVAAMLFKSAARALRATTASGATQPHLLARRSERWQRTPGTHRRVDRAPATGARRLR